MSEMETYKGFTLRPADEGWYEYENEDKTRLGSKESRQEAKDYIDELLSRDASRRSEGEKKRKEVGAIWCPDCASNHVKPTTQDQHRALQCEAPYIEPKITGQDD